MKTTKKSKMIIALIFTTSFPIEFLRNRIGNIVFTKTHAGPAIRKWVNPFNPQSLAQTAVRGFFQQFSTAWSSLDPADILGWNTAADNYQKTNTLGYKYVTTGKALFVAWNVQNALFGGGTQIDAYFAPTAPTIVGANTLAASGAGAFTFTTTDAVDANSGCVIEATPSLSQGTTNTNGKFKRIGYIPAGAAAGAQDFGSEYVAVFGNPVSGQKIEMQISTLNNDQFANVELSGKLKLTCTVS